MKKRPRFRFTGTRGKSCIGSISQSLDKEAIVKYKGRGAKYKLKVPRADVSPEYAAAEQQGNF